MNHIIPFKDGIFVGDTSVHLTSYLGVLARTMMPIRYKDWRDVPIQLKEKLWDSIEVTYLYSKRLLLTYYYSLKDKDTNNFLIICRLLLHWIKEVGEIVCEQ